MCNCALHNYAQHFRGKKIRLFVFGDYEFLCKMYGISGASGRTIQMINAHQSISNISCRTPLLPLL